MTKYYNGPNGDSQNNIHFRNPSQTRVPSFKSGIVGTQPSFETGYKTKVKRNTYPIFSRTH